MRDVFIAGTGMSRFGKHLGAGLRELGSEVLGAALYDSGMVAGDVEAIYFANAAGGLITGQEMIRGQVALRFSGLEGVPVLNVENACASGSSAAHLAWLSVASGQYDVAVAVGVEKLIHQDKQRSFDAIESGTNLVDLKREAPQVEGASTSSVMMGVYARKAAAYLESYGATVQSLAAVAAKNRRHASCNPLAHFQDPITVEDVLASRIVSAPLTLLMCSPLTDGAAAVVFCAERCLGGQAGPRVRLLASVVASGADGMSPVVERVARRSFEKAGVGPTELDVVELHDAAAPAEIIQYEQIGLCGVGQGHKLAIEGNTSLGGTIPINTSGGLLSRGHPLGATGCAQLVELYRQLRGEAYGRQVDGARLALAMNVGGWMGSDYAAAVGTILAR